MKLKLPKFLKFTLMPVIIGIFIMLAYPSFAIAQDTITANIGDYAVEPGTSTDVAIDLQTGAAKIGAVTLFITYDSSVVTATSCSVNPPLSGACNIDVAGVVKASGIDFTGLGVSGDINFATITFSAGGSRGSATQLELSVVTFSDIGGNDVVPSVSGGSVSINNLVDTGCGGLQQEAEAGTLSGAFVAVTDNNASGGTHVYVPDSVNEVWDGADGENQVAFCATVVEAGLYRIKATAAANGTLADSFYVHLDSAPATEYLWDTPTSTSFSTSYVSDRNGMNPVEILLAAGEHNVVFSLRESGTQLDSIELELVQNENLSVGDCSGLTREAEDGTFTGDFVTVNDSTASGGQYVHVPEGNGTEWTGPNAFRQANYCFTVDQGGTYLLEGIVSGADDLSDSFYIRVNDLPSDAYLWDTVLADNFTAEYASDRNGQSPLMLMLAPGINTVTVYAREDGSRLDKLTLIPQETSTPPSICTGLTREAEEGNLIGDFEIGTDASASGGQYVHVPDGNGMEWDGPNDFRKAMYCFTVDQAGVYVMKGKVYGADDLSDSFYVQVNDDSSTYLWDSTSSASYVDDLVSDRNVADPVTVILTAGQNIVSVFLREDGTRLDTLTLEPFSAAIAATENGTVDANKHDMALGVHGTIHLQSNEVGTTVERDAVDFAQFSMTVVDASTNGQRFSKTVTLDANGSYRIDNMESGDYLLTLSVPSGYTSLMETQIPLVLSSDQETRVSPDVLKLSTRNSQIYMPLISGQ